VQGRVGSDKGEKQDDPVHIDPQLNGTNTNVKRTSNLLCDQFVAQPPFKSFNSLHVSRRNAVDFVNFGHTTINAPLQDTVDESTLQGNLFTHLLVKLAHTFSVATQYIW
jgi:hypothetical protein